MATLRYVPGDPYPWHIGAHRFNNRYDALVHASTVALLCAKGAYLPPPKRTDDHND